MRCTYGKRSYTIVVTSPTVVLSPLLYANLPFDPIRDFAPVARLASIENVMLVHPSVPVKALKDMANAGMDPWLGGPEEMAQLVRSEMARCARIIKSAGIRKEAL